MPVGTVSCHTGLCKYEPCHCTQRFLFITLVHHAGQNNEIINSASCACYAWFGSTIAIKSIMREVKLQRYARGLFSPLQHLHPMGHPVTLLRVEEEECRCKGPTMPRCMSHGEYRLTTSNTTAISST